MLTRRLHNPPPAPGHESPQSGRITVGACVTGLALLICAGIAVDLTGQVQAEQELRDQAYSCARQGAHYATIDFSPSTSTALMEARTCIDAIGVTADVIIQSDRLVVTASGTYTTRLLSIILIKELPITADATVGLHLGN